MIPEHWLLAHIEEHGSDWLSWSDEAKDEAANQYLHYNSDHSAMSDFFKRHSLSTLYRSGLSPDEIINELKNEVWAQVEDPIATQIEQLTPSSAAR